MTRYRDGWPVSSASQPAMVAAMLEQLRLPEGGSVLEIGAGTGYNAALLSGLVGASGRVVTIDIDPEVAEEARSHLAGSGRRQRRGDLRGRGPGLARRRPLRRDHRHRRRSDLAPAWASQLAPGGRLVVPLSIRGVQQCVAFTPADGHLSSVAVCGCQFMPLTGAMANGDQRLPVPGHPGVHLQAAAETDVDAARSPTSWGVGGQPRTQASRCGPRDVFASLRPWLAFREPALATLTYSGPPDAAEASGVPAVIDFTVRGVTRRASPCLPGPAGLAVLDFSGPGVTQRRSGSWADAPADRPRLRRGPAAASQAQGADRGLGCRGPPGTRPPPHRRLPLRRPVPRMAARARHAACDLRHLLVPGVSAGRGQGEFSPGMRRVGITVEQLFA